MLLCMLKVVYMKTFYLVYAMCIKETLRKIIEIAVDYIVRKGILSYKIIDWISYIKHLILTLTHSRGNHNFWVKAMLKVFPA